MKINRKILSNAVSLYGLEVANYIFPLVTFPYILRVIDIADFGNIQYVAAIIQIVVMITSFSFSYTATERIANRQGDTEYIAEVYSRVLTFQVGLALVSGLVLAIAVLLYPKFMNNISLFLVLFPMVFGHILFPTWLFQGLEKMSLITMLSVVSRAITTGLLFVLVKNADDYLYVAALQASYFVLAGLFSQVVLRYRFNVHFRLFLDWEGYRKLLAESADAFFSTLPSQIYGRGAIVVLGFFASSAQLGYYAVGQKIAGLLSNLATPVARAIYPRACQLAKESLDSFQKLKVQLVTAGAVAITITVLALNIFVEPLVLLISGKVEPGMVAIIRFFSPAMIFTFLNMLLNIFLMALKRYSKLRRLYVVAAVVFLGCGFPLAYLYQDKGMAITLALVNLLITIGFIVITRSDFKKTISSPSNSI